MTIFLFSSCVKEKKKIICHFVYIVVEVSLFDIYDLLHGNISMRDALLKNKEYWMVFSGTDISDDIVERRRMKDIDQSCLPKKDACFKVLTESMEQYVEIIDNMLSIQQNYISISKLETGYGKEMRSVIELTQYRFLKESTKTLGDYSDWDNIIFENEVVLETNDKLRIYENSIIAA